MQDFLTYFLFAFLLISVYSYNVTETEEVISNLEPQNNLIKNTTHLPSTDLNKLSSKLIPVNKTLQAKYDENNNLSLEIVPRVSRDVTKEPKKKMECLSCYGSGPTSYDDDCYKGESKSKVNCAEPEACYTELHPQYIKRGCILPSNINRTFVCKCPLCNDKPAADPTYYDYKTFNDWQFDNEHLEEPITGLDLLCKICETTGQNHVSDQICRNGSGTNYMLCGTNQLCVTNIIPTSGFVSRGCTAPPAFNTINVYCRTNSCNSESYENPSRNRRSIAYKLLQNNPYKNTPHSDANLSLTNCGVLSALSTLVLGKFISSLHLFGDF